MSDEIVKVPDIGDASDVEVIELCVAPGDQVEKDDSLIVLESDKASMEIPSPAAGVISSISLEVGSKVSEGDEILVLTTGAETAAVAEEADAPAAQPVAEPSEPTAETATASGAEIEVQVPDIGDSEDVEVIEIAVKEGDEVEKDDTLIVLESDKASMEIPSPQAGAVKSIGVSLGDKVSQGSLILVLGSTGGAVEEAAAPVDSITSTPSPTSAPANAPQPAAETVTLKVPDIGDSDTVEVIEIPVAVGDTVALDDTLVVLESDKASMEVPSTHAGVIKAVLLEVGQQVKQDTPMVVLAPEGAFASPAGAKAKPAETSPVAPTAPAVSETVQAPPAAPKKSGELVYAGPAVRMLARELGVDLSLVEASGPRGRVLKEDVQNFVKRALAEKSSPAATGSAIPEIPAVDFSQFGKVETVPMSRVQKLTATAMHRSWLNVPHVTHFDEADVTDLEEFRAMKKAQAQERGLKLTPLPFLLKACAAALKKFPQFNVSLAPSGEELIQKHYCHIGIAMDTPAGLMVPVLRDVDKKGVWELAEEAAELGTKGQQGKLSRDDLQGGCFTVSSLGAIGGTGFTPIVNTPEVAILGVSRTSVKPVYRNNEFVPRSMLPLALSYDHRAINGVDAGQFMTFLTQVLSDIRKLVM